jgi:hypothetical protein
VSAPARVPANTDSTRGPHFRALAGGGTAVVTGAVLALIAFTIGAASHVLWVMVGGPIAVVVAILVACWFVADSQAEDEFFNRFAAAHAMTHSAKYWLDGLTPLLSGGERRRCEHWMQSRELGIGWYTFEVKQDHGDAPDTWQSFEFTLSTVDLGELGMRRFQGIYLRRRRGLFDHLDRRGNWLSGHHLVEVELESTAFGQRYELWRDRAQDEIVLRQLFSPSFVVWLSEHPLAPGFELRAGMLVVFLQGHCTEAGKLDWLLMGTREIAKRIQLELTEAARASWR